MVENITLDHIKTQKALDDEEISFSAYETAVLYSPRDIVESFRACEKVYKKMKLVGKNIVDKKDLNIQLGRDNSLDKRFIGQYLKYKDTECIDIGLNTNLLYWNVEDIRDSDKAGDDYVFSIAFEKCYLGNRDLPIAVTNYFDDGDWIYIPLNRKYLVNDQYNGALESEIEKIIKEVFLPNVNL